MLGITFLTHNDNESLLAVVSQFLSRTTLPENLSIHVLAQCCSDSYKRSFETLVSKYSFIKLHFIDENIGVSRANNRLFEFTKDCEFVLHIEDDWILHLDTPKNWLQHCLQHLQLNPDVSTMILRRYMSDEERLQYGWSRHIPYSCHKHTDNFNFESKRLSPLTYFLHEETYTTTEIPTFLFTFNPVIRRNKDYIQAGVYPIIEFDDIDKDLSELLDTQTLKKNHTNSCWGWSEALTMEKTRHLKSVLYNEGIFMHYDDSIDYCKKHRLGLMSNDVSNSINNNCHVPVIVFHSGVLIDYSLFKHSFLRFIHIFDTSPQTMITNEYISSLLSLYSPKTIVTIGSSFTKILSGLHFEFRKRWIHYNKISEFNLYVVENCIFNSFYKHPYEKDNPLISIITPSYESEHRIFRPYYSLLQQTYTNWEWIIIDDSKTEDTWTKLVEFSTKDPRIQIHRRHKNSGYIGNNKHFCGSLSKGKLIFELDHDDDILPITLERLVQAYKKYPDAGFFYSDCIECSEPAGNGYLAPFNYGDHFSFGYGSYYRSWLGGDFQFMAKASRMNPHTFRHIVGVPNHFRCWTREAYLDAGSHNTHLSVADDYDLILRTMFKYRWCHIPEMLYIQYRNAGGNNFTFHRNALIQYLVNKLRWTYEEDIHKRLVQLGVNDDKHKGQPGHCRDYEVNHFEYPIIDYTYLHADQDPNNPYITVIIPTYNRPEHLRKALDSVFSQTYRHFEVIVVGDKCPVLDRFIREYPNARDKRFKYFNLSHNNGAGGATPRNYAIKMLCNTTWIAYLDDDNVWKENHLESLVQTLRKNPDASYIFSSMVIDNKELIFEEPKKGRIDTSCVLHRFDLCVKYGLWKNRVEGGYAHDWEFMSRWKDEKWVATKECTLIYNTEFNGQSYEQLIQM